MPLDDEWDEFGDEAPVASVPPKAPEPPTAAAPSKPTEPSQAAAPSKPSEPPAEGTLRALANGEPIEPRRALLIVRQVLAALAEIHARGGVHGDVKPENIHILPGLGDPRIELALARTATGDPVYRAPEAALGGIDALGDIYATGAVLFELLTGHPPFFADDPEALRRLHAYAPMQTLKQRAPDLAFVDLLEPIVATALEKKRDARYASAKDMIAALDPALQAIEQAAARPAAGGGERRRKPNDSLLLLAKDLMPQAQVRTSDPMVPVNVARQVPELPLTARAELAGRKVLARLPLDRLTKQHKQIGLAVAGIVVLVLILLVTCRGHHKATTPTQPVAPTKPAAAPTKPAAPPKPAEPPTKPEAPSTPGESYWHGTETR